MTLQEENALFAERKLAQCRRLIEQCGRYYEATQDDIYQRIAKEAEADAVYWQAYGAGHSHENASMMAYGKLK